MTAAVVAFVALAVPLALPAASRATTLERLTVAQLSRHAVTVAAGTVVSTEVKETSSGVLTEVRLRVSRTFKGVASRYLTLTVPGGVLPHGRRVVVPGMPGFGVGEHSVVFLDVFGRVIGGVQGELDISRGNVDATGESLASLGRRIRAAVAGSAYPAAAPDGGRAQAQTSGGRSSRAASGVVITGIEPSSASAGTDTRVTISGSGFGATQGQVFFSYGRKGVMRIASRSIRAWSDTSIICTVPTGIIDNYAASAGNGPVVVTTASLADSGPFAFFVPFGYGGAAWTPKRATYRVNTSGVDDALRTSLVEAGAATWSAAGADFAFVSGGPTTASLSSDGINVISWSSSLAAGVLAMSYSDEGAGVISEADVQFNNAYSWGDGTAGSGTYDIQTIATHELGHWLVLLDQYMSGDAEKVMYGYGDEDVQKRALSADDIAGIRWIYGGGQTPTPTPTSSPSPTATPSPTPTPTPTPVDLGPVCRVKNATARRGALVALQYMVTDDMDLVLRRTISISTTAGVVKRSWTGVTRSATSWQSFRFKCDLKKGTYRLSVSATDLAGHPARIVGRATLTVR